MREKSRGAFDFETYGGFGSASSEIKPACCGLLWEEGEAEEYLEDTGFRHPARFAEKVLKTLYSIESVNEWWAHNMGNFDGLILSAAARRLGWHQSAIIAGQTRVISLTLRPKDSKRSLRLFDSTALVPNKLADIAKDFELPSRKLFTKDDYSKDVRHWEAERRRAGCLIDCKLVLEMLSKLESLVADWGGTVKRTFSSTALSIVKSKLAEKNEKIPSHYDNPQINPIARAAYYGARVEVLHHLPRKQLIEYDVCSSYPAAMAKPIPWKFVKHVKSKKDARFHYYSGESMLLRARVHVPSNVWLPPLPFRPDEMSGVFFPTGDWEAWFPACELNYAENLGVRVTILEGLLYETSEPFTEFINQVYELKATSKGAVRNFSKLILNGCYGKFGEKPEHANLEVFATQYEAEDFSMKNPGKCTPLSKDGTMLAVGYSRWAPHAHYGVASYITGRARIALHQFLSQSQQPAYCDSDSIHCVSWNGTPSNDLGALKIEIPSYRGEFYAPKIYRLILPSGETKLAAKGFPVTDVSFRQMLLSAVDALEGIEKVNRRKVQTSRIRKLKSQLRSGGTNTLWMNQEKTWAGLSMKRRPLRDGSTVPWTVEELLNKEYKTAVSPALLSFARKVSK